MIPETNHLERLMVSGGMNDSDLEPGARLVKGEWDAAEVWLKKCPYPPIQPSVPTP